MFNWEKVILKQEDIMQTAIQVLDKESLRIVLVVDEDERLIGTVTDGDIRRGLIKHFPMDVQITEIMHKEPTTAFVKDNNKLILSKMKEFDLLQIPIIDKNRKIVGLKTLQHMLGRSRYDNPVFLMAGGFGKRLQPLTKHTPKPMLNVGTRPILENILNQFIDAGFCNFYISTHYKAKVVQEHFGDGSKWGVTIKYIHEDKPLGTAGGLGLLPNGLPRKPILMMNGDLLTKIDFSRLLNFHLELGGDATVCVREYDFQVPYGVIKSEGSCITAIKEKPIHRFFVNAGIYVLNPSVFDNIDGSTYIDMPQLLEQKIKDGNEINMFPLHEYWLDIGHMEQFEQAQKDSNKLFK
jgi:dTDP-glucose pyrophosphorylase